LGRTTQKKKAFKIVDIYQATAGDCLLWWHLPAQQIGWLAGWLE